MTDTRDSFGREEIAGGTLEEFQHGLVLPRRRVRDINDDLCASQRRRQSLPRDRIDALRRGRGHDFVTLLTELLTSLVPIRPVPPMTTIFMVLFLVSEVWFFITRSSLSRYAFPCSR